MNVAPSKMLSIQHIQFRRRVYSIQLPLRRSRERQLDLLCVITVYFPQGLALDTTCGKKITSTHMKLGLICYSGMSVRPMGLIIVL